ncbi:MAG TPA: Calx-beta domain-containing protein [Tepidisphaeraceae bacterium]|jgi:hypothetical protein
MDVSWEMGGHRPQPSSPNFTAESLESRTLLAATTIGIYASLNASETNPLGAGRGEFVVKRPTGSTVNPLTLQYYVRSTSTATSGKDFKVLSGSVTIKSGKRSAAISVFPIDDNLHEPPEAVELILKSGTITNVHSRAAITIADNDPVSTAVSVSAFDGIASETDPTSAGKGRILFQRTQGSTANALVVNYTTVGTSTAKNGVDVQLLSGKVTIPAGAQSVFVDVIPINDAVVEPTERITVALKAGDYLITGGNATVTITDNDTSAAPSGWFDSSRHFRAPINVDVGSFARTDAPVDHAINFTSVLNALGKGGSLVDNSIRVVEVSADGHTMLDGSVPFQFNKDSDFNASSNASGDLVLLMGGNTAANAVRHFQVYFDTTGSFAAPNFTSLVTTTSTGITDEGFDSIRIANQTATFYYQKATGGFSSIVDSNGNDWISWHPTGGSDGEFRGTPNLGPVGFHPGRDPVAGSSQTESLSTAVVSNGPLKTVIESTASISGNKVRWEFYPTFARCTVLSMDQNYWFLYEGTPGGSISAHDTVVESDGTTTDVNSGTEWDHDHVLGAGNGQEWAYFRDADVNSGGGGRYMYFVHNTPDNIVDSYYTMESNMTVFGFARQNALDHSSTSQLFDPGSTPNTFTIGIANGGDNFSAASTLINGAYRDISVTAGSPDALS